ncbi:MAG TPA: tetratricopeptide repeat protein [Bacteroidales bacterium]|nr:MAG: hypothetical protein BWY22_01264 [Bacteroidetes bacterium ADurb.Bin217]HPH16182.1 tetratricopeptide repeat protein [Bacteroidales bacterium]HPM12367.1 tetratricopeptide repeat protein [Bacteroidales bacterium]
MKKYLLVFILIIPLLVNSQIDSSVYKIGISHLTNCKFKKAYKYFNKQSKKVNISNYPDILYYKAVSYNCLNKDAAKTITYFNDYIKLNPNDYRAYVRRGICYYKTFYQNNKAKSDFLKALELNPFNPEANYYLASLYSIKRDTIQTELIEIYYNQFFNLVDSTHFLFNYAHRNRAITRKKFNHNFFLEDQQYLKNSNNMHIYVFPTRLMSQDTIKFDIQNFHKKYGYFVSSGNLKDTITFNEFIKISSLKELLHVDSVVSFMISFSYGKYCNNKFIALSFTGDSFENSIIDYLYKFVDGNRIYFEDITAIKNGSVPQKYAVMMYEYKLTYDDTR